MKIRSLLTATPLAAISASLLTFSPEAHAAQLLYGLDFNTLGDNGIVFNNIGSGLTAITSSGSGYNNYNVNVPSPIGDGGASHVANSGTFSITDTTNGILGLDISKGFSITLDIYALPGIEIWKNAITFGFGSANFQMERNGAGGWSLFGAGGLNEIARFATSQTGDWLNLNFVFQGNQLSIYNAGKLLTSSEIGNNLNLETFKLTQIICGGTKKTPTILIDNLGVYDGVLSSSDFAYISKKGLVASIPEPTTATLSLLGLVALLGIRRRQH